MALAASAPGGLDTVRMAVERAGRVALRALLTALSGDAIRIVVRRPMRRGDSPHPFQP